MNRSPYVAIAEGSTISIFIFVLATMNRCASLHYNNAWNCDSVIEIYESSRKRTNKTNPHLF